MSVFEPKKLRKEDLKDIFNQTFQLLKRTSVPFLTFNIILFAVFTFLFKDWFGFLNFGIFSFVFFFLTLGFESSFSDAADGKSIGPESFFKCSKDFLKMNDFKKVILFIHVTVMGCYFIVGFLIDMSVTFKSSVTFWERHWIYVNSLAIIGYFNVFLIGLNYKYLLMRNKNIDYLTAKILCKKALKNNTYLNMLEGGISAATLLFLMLFLMLEIPLLSLMMMLIWFCFKVSIYRVVFENKGKLSEVRQEEISLVASSVNN